MEIQVFYTHLHSFSGEGNGNPLQYSCLENPVNGGDWWAAVHTVAQSRKRLKRLSMYACILFNQVIKQQTLAFKLLWVVLANPRKVANVNKSPTHWPPSSELSKMGTFPQCLVWATLQLALHLLLLTILQLYFPHPAIDSSCLFTRCQPPCAGCCAGLLDFSRYFTGRLKMFYFLCLFFNVLFVWKVS